MNTYRTSRKAYIGRNRTVVSVNVCDVQTNEWSVLKAFGDHVDFLAKMLSIDEEQTGTVEIQSVTIRIPENFLAVSQEVYVRNDGTLSSRRVLVILGPRENNDDDGADAEVEVEAGAEAAPYVELAL